MNMDRTINLKLDLSEYDKETLRLAMSMSNHVFNEIARYGFENHTSSNDFFSSKSIKNVRAKYAYLRAKLQSKGTRSAKKLLRNISRKEERFVTWVNHNISKEIAAMPYDVLAIEDLTSIRVQSRAKGVKFTKKLNNWSFYQLEQFLRYKAEAFGKSVITIDPRYTSQKCSKCGHIYKGNRKDNSFHCVKCGFQIHADLNAARNIAILGKSGDSRRTVTSPYIACDDAEARKGIDADIVIMPRT